MSSASSSSSSLVTPASPRRASALRTWSGEARSSLRSITALLEGEARVETPVAAVLVDQDLEIDAAGDQIDGEHVELGVQGLAQPEGAAQGARAHQRHDVDVHRDRLVQNVTARGRDGERVEGLRDDLNAGALGQADCARWQQHGAVRRVDVEREVEVRRLVGANELPPVQLVGGRRRERRALEREQRDRLHEVRQHLRGVALMLAIIRARNEGLLRSVPGGPAVGWMLVAWLGLTVLRLEAAA